MDTMSVLMNPVRNRIVQQLVMGRAATAGQLSELMPDVPRTTLYRHLNTLTEHGFLSVVSEQRVRGSVERTFALNSETLADNSRPENLLQNIFAFLIKIYSDFADYFASEDADARADRLFVSNAHMLLTDAEFDEMQKGLNELFGKYLAHEPGHGRKSRSISFVSSPSQDKGSV